MNTILILLFSDLTQKRKNWKIDKLEFLEKQLKASLAATAGSVGTNGGGINGSGLALGDSGISDFQSLSALVQMNSESKDASNPNLDKKTRREIANSNERRRMQSINSGFMRLKSLVPSISKEKVSKVRTIDRIRWIDSSHVMF